METVENSCFYFRFFVYQVHLVYGHVTYLHTDSNHTLGNIHPRKNMARRLAKINHQTPQIYPIISYYLQYIFHIQPSVCLKCV